ncbi:hypothetical protein [Actinomycetospora lemnae]|uniref:Uncharacterized protein n=1 Tax=Actinomycetospora lemnae TaxID=3019891 RepID=A0ABT5SZG7_9PSEU|nr:hypothetical protein [Actinomycetospora sp. DW7H6]MDD7968149.1 hypothetical protein [Actinomycetospora sp. DW7H6]
MRRGPSRRSSTAASAGPVQARTRSSSSVGVISTSVGASPATPASAHHARTR